MAAMDKKKVKVMQDKAEEDGKKRIKVIEKSCCLNSLYVEPKFDLKNWKSKMADLIWPIFVNHSFSGCILGAN